MGLALYAGVFLGLSGFGNRAQSRQTYVPTAIERAVGYKVDALLARPGKEQQKGAAEVAGMVQRMSPSIYKLNLAQRVASQASNSSWSGEPLQAAADALADALSRLPPMDPKYQNGANDILANLYKYFGAKVDLDTPGYKSALAKLDAKTQARQNCDFSLPDMDGRTWTLSQLKGKIVLVDFWGLSCPPCLAEMPTLDRAQEQFRDQGLVVLAVTNDTAVSIRRYLEGHPLHMPILSDPSWSLGKKFEVTGIPVNLLYDRKGRLVAESLGPWTEDELAGKLQTLGLKQLP